MRYRSGLFVVMCALAGGCGKAGNADRRTPQAATNPDADRNAAFWKEVASIHFTEDRSHQREPLPTATLFDGGGRPVTLAAMRGKPVFVNFWAHWCVPCRAEMPTIDAMAASRGAAIRVVAVNEDGVQPASRSLGPLKMHPAIVRLTDTDLRLAKAIAGQGLPTTVLYGSDGRERWRLVGVLDWTKPQARKLLDEAI